MSKTRIQLIGSFLAPLENELSKIDIRVESHIQSCSPLAMQGDADNDYLKKSNEKNVPPHSVLNIRKNLKQILSRDEAEFCSNYNTQPPGKEVRIKNTSEYLVFMNSSSELPLYDYNGTVYSAADDVFNSIKKDGFIRRNFPFNGSFNWKYYYDKFIDIILDEYDSEHIILIKSNSAQWYMDGMTIKCFGKNSSLLRNMINKMDEYFIERTKCRVINEHFNHIPPRLFENWFPCIQFSSNTFKEMAQEINCAITRPTNTKYNPFLPKYGTDFTKFLQKKLTSEIFSEHEKIISLIAENWLTLKEIKEKKMGGNEDFLADLIKLEQFLNPANERTLSDYVIELGNTSNTADISLAELYTNYFRLDINDVIAVYMLSEKYENKSVFKGIVKNILNNKECYPANAAGRFKDSNISFLKKYPYLSMKDFTNSDRDVYIRLENNSWLVLNGDSDTPIIKFDFKVSETFSFKKVISEGYVCKIEDADALTYSYDYYIEKARCGDENKPTFLKFETKSDFLKSINFIDYPSLLENEKFVFDIGECSLWVNEDYEPITNMKDLFDPDTVTVWLCSGLGDQLGYYILGQMIEKYYGKKVIYDDLSYFVSGYNTFNGLEILKLAINKINLLSNMLSPRLRNTPNRFKNIFLKISSDAAYLTLDSCKNLTNTLNAKEGLVVLKGARVPLKTFLGLQLSYKYYHIIYHCEDLKQFFNYNIHDYIKFPEYDNAEQKRIAQSMKECDSIAIHIRRGDYITHLDKLNKPQIDYTFYRNAISNISKLTQYQNKKYFIFSDDIMWCVSNKAELGLDLVCEEVTFVNSNHYDDSFRDIQLMTNAKVLVCAQSGFARFAALYNDNLEIFVSYYTGYQKLFEQYIRKNKYDIDTGEENK